MDRRLVVFASCAAAAYLVLLFAGAGPSTLVAVKPLAVLALAVGAWRAEARLLAAALAIHAVGDVAIEIGGILAGIGPFLLGHVLYARVLWPLLPPKVDLGVDGLGVPTLGSLGRRLLVAAMAGWAGFLISLLLPRLDGALAMAVPAYAAALLVMVSTAALSRVEAITILGAVLYVASDSILAIDAFVVPLAWRDFAVWPTYAIGQILLATGIVRALRRQPNT